MRTFNSRLLDYSPFYRTSNSIMKQNTIHSTNRAGSLFLHAVVVTILSMMIVLQSVTLIFGPTIPDAAAVVPDFNVAAAGDWGCKTATTSTVNNIVSKNTEVTIGLGDNSYATTADCWFSKIAPIDGQMHTAIGNHDVTSAQILAQYMNHYNMQQQYYSFNYQNIHFLVLSTEAAYGVGSAQYNFVQGDLQNTACNPAINWIIVAYHKPAYQSPSTNHNPLPDLRDIYHPIFEKYSVDLVLQGHMHSYERSYPLKFNSANPGSPIIESTSTSTYNDPVGQIFATVGTGGQSSYTFSSKDPAFVTQSPNMFGFLNIDMLNNGLTLKGTFFGNDGSTRDQFTIQKSSTPPACNTNTTSPYNYEPSLTLSGTNYQDVLSSGDKQLSAFSVAAWFKTTNDYTGNAFIVNKGGSGSETAGKNMNYGIWMTSAEKIQAGFETSTGTGYIAASPGVYNDGKWHYAVATYDGSSTVRLYIDGPQVATKTTSGALPDKGGAQPLRIGANSLSVKDFFVGSGDEVRVWNRAVSATEVSSQYNSGTFDTTGQVAYLSFSSTSTASPATANALVGEDNSVNEGNPPTANTGQDQTVNEGVTVTLDGSGSSDSDGTIASYAWTQTAGPAVTLSDSKVQKPTFTAPQVTQDTTLRFELVVTDNGGTKSAPATVQVLVKNVVESPPPPPTDISTALTMSPISNVPWGKTVTVTGKLVNADDGGSAISGQTITLTGTGINPQQTVSAKTQSDGTFTATFTAPSTVASGWTVQAHYAGYAGGDDGSSKLLSSDSEERTFATLKHGTTLSLTLDPTQVAKAGSYAVHGVLKDSITNEFIGSMTITFTADNPISIKSTNTDSSGSYQLSGLKAPTKKGSYDIEAKFAGNSLYNPATSVKKTLVVR
jgi:predicted phosphodiesterase